VYAAHLKWPLSPACHAVANFDDDDEGDYVNSSFMDNCSDDYGSATATAAASAPADDKINVQSDSHGFNRDSYQV
jgi:hypothetical protein